MWGAEYLLLLVVDDHVLRLDVAVHDPVAVGVVESFQDLVDVVPAVFGRNDLQQFAILSRDGVFQDQAEDLALLYYVQQLYAVVTSVEGHQDLDLTVHLPELD